MKIAICFIGTGKYLNFFPNYYETINQYFIPECEKHFFVFTDGELNEPPDNITLVPVQDRDRPYDQDDNMYKSVGGLYRFEVIYDKINYFKDYDLFVYIDGDYYCCEESISYQEFFDDKKDFFAIQHPTFSSYWSKFSNQLPHENNPKSWAYISKEDYDDVYLQGCLWGGKVPEVFDMIHELKNKTLDDMKMGIIPRAQDEAYLNKYRMNNIDKFHVVHPCFGKPGNISGNEFSFTARMVHSPEYRNEVLK